MGRLAHVTPTVPAQQCLAGYALHVLQQTDPETASELAALYATDGVRHSTIAHEIAGLPEITFRVTESTIGRHRRGTCTCGNEA